MHADLRLGFEYNDFPASLREGPPDGETRNTSPHDNSVETFSRISLAYTARRDANTSRAPKSCAIPIRFCDCDSVVGFHDPRCFFPFPIVLKIIERDRNIDNTDFVAVCRQSSFCH